jgi:hypothetical protein
MRLHNCFAYFHIESFSAFRTMPKLVPLVVTLSAYFLLSSAAPNELHLLEKRQSSSINPIVAAFAAVQQTATPTSIPGTIGPNKIPARIFT